MIHAMSVAARLIGLAVLVPLSPRHAPVAAFAPRLQLIAAVGGQPDDITVDRHGRLIWGDLAAGTIEQLAGGRVTVLARGLMTPEGVATLADGTLLVAEQGRDRVLRIGPGGKRSVLFALRPVAGQDGVDGVGWDARAGRVLIPDSPRGTVLSVSLDGRHVRVLARHLGRPVAAMADAHGSVLVPDEHLGTLVVIARNGTIVDRGVLATPDDVAVNATGRIWITTLGDNSLWTIDPGASAPRRILSGLANPQGLTLDACGDPIVVEQNAGRIVRLLLSASAARCPL